MQKQRSSLFLKRSLFLAGGVFTFLLFSYAMGPNFDLHFSREVPSDLSTDRLARNFSSIHRWPQWFYSLSKVIETDAQGNPLAHPTSELKKGTFLKLEMNPNKGERKKFNLLVEINEYEPERSIHFKVLQDSSGRLTRLFDRLEWTIEILPDSRAGGSRIRAQSVAHTAHWRSRIFGHITERILMNQIFYPNLMKLAELKQPFSVEASPLTGRSGDLAAP